MRSPLFFGIREYIAKERKSRELLNHISLEAKRLHPQDFTFELTATVGPSGLPKFGFFHNKSDTVPDSFSLFAFIGDDKKGVSVRGTRTRLEQPPSEFPSHSPIGNFPYVGRDLIIFGLNELPYLDSLAGKNVRFYIPRGLIEYGPLNWSYTIDVFIRGTRLRNTFGGENPLVEPDILTIEIPSTFPET